MKNKVISLILTIFFVISLSSVFINATNTETNEYRLGKLYNTGKDNGYSEQNEIDKDDPHFNWTLGDFFVTGYTRQINANDNTPVFLKNVGDKVTLWFNLQQDINALNGDDKLYISDDKNGYDEIFDIEKQNFKKGVLIIKQTNYQNKSSAPQVHIDYLSAKVSKNADTEVFLCEEGDYEVSLLYEIKSDNFLFFDSYYNYRIDFKFSVRNGNAMVFPFDIETGKELTDSVFTENGFYIDLANSKYLNVNVKKEILSEGIDGLVEDTRFNRPAKDKEKFTEEGIYTITVTNQYTNVTTEKKIYVGTNNILKAHIVTGMSIQEIKDKLSDGKSEIDTNGNIVPVKITEDSTQPSSSSAPLTEKEQTSSPLNEVTYIYIFTILITVSILFIFVVIIIRRKKSKIYDTNEDE